MRARIGTSSLAAIGLAAATLTGIILGATSSVAPASAVTTFTTAEVTPHNSATSCWSIVDGKVYDLTSWIDVHRGGRGVILSMCGVDATTAFHNMHGVSGGAVNTLGSFQIGVIGTPSPSPSATTPAPTPSATTPTPTPSATTPTPTPSASGICRSDDDDDDDFGDDHGGNRGGHHEDGDDDSDHEDGDHEDGDDDDHVFVAPASVDTRTVCADDDDLRPIETVTATPSATATPSPSATPSATTSARPSTRFTAAQLRAMTPAALAAVPASMLEKFKGAAWVKTLTTQQVAALSAKQVKALGLRNVKVEDGKKSSRSKSSKRR